MMVIDAERLMEKIDARIIDVEKAIPGLSKVFRHIDAAESELNTLEWIKSVIEQDKYSMKS